MTAADQLTVCVLTYGNYPALADRCLRSVRQTLGYDVEARVGCNAVCAETAETAMRYATRGRVWTSVDNTYKYPMMRRMFYEQRIATPWIMWFDDDSWFADNANRDGDAWLSRWAAAAKSADLLGSLYRMGWRGNQQGWIKDQPWYGGVDPLLRPRAEFVTGGWWCVRTEIVYNDDYPWTAAAHNGGDVMLSELCRQRGRRIVQFRDSVYINADDAGRESASPRRGCSTPAIGELYRL